MGSGLARVLKRPRFNKALEQYAKALRLSRTPEEQALALKNQAATHARYLQHLYGLGSSTHCGLRRKTPAAQQSWHWVQVQRAVRR